MGSEHFDTFKESYTSLVLGIGVAVFLSASVVLDFFPLLLYLD